MGLQEYLKSLTDIIAAMENSQQNNHPKVQFIEVEEDRAGQRIDNFLLSILKRVPRTHIYRILRKGEVRVNKGRIKPDYKIKAGDVVRVPPVRIASAKEIPAASKQLLTLLEASVLYEDKALLIVNKPSGIAVHGGSGISLGLIEALRQMRPQEKFLELVHRLDRETSGCIMIAKKRSMLRYLHDLLRDGHQIQKFYHALVAGKWPERRTQVNAPLRKNELEGGERIVRVDQTGKESLTHFKVLKHYKDCSLVEAKPFTGRTHQIRVHAQHVGHGLIGDDKYGNDDLSKLMKAKGVNRLFLHAAALEFRLPETHKLLRVEAPLDKRLQDALQQIAKAR